MEHKKRLGIWMDHTKAHAMEFNSETSTTSTLETDLTHKEREVHNLEQHEENQYYKELGAVIKNYNEVLLFGPTDAKAQLANMLKEDSHFEHIAIHTEQADKMTDNQQHAFVNDYFSKHH